MFVQGMAELPSALPETEVTIETKTEKIDTFDTVVTEPTSADISSSAQTAPTMMPSSNALPSLSKHLKQGIPLLLLVVCNAIYAHTISIVLFIALVVVFDWSNNVVIRQTTLQNRRSSVILVALSLFLLLNAGLAIPVVQKLWLFNLINFPFWFKSDSYFWEVLFNIAVMDYVLKFITISLKSFLLLPTTAVIQTHARSGLFIFFEALSQLLRCLMPIPQWIRYILSSSSCVAGVICWLVGLLYCVIKFTTLKSKFELVECGWDSWRKPQVIGRPVLEADEVNSLQSCPICRQKCKDPVALSCNHAFCHSCCQIWFDWDKHCPVCSSEAVYSVVMGEAGRMSSLLQITSKNSIWRRGATDYFVQLF